MNKFAIASLCLVMCLFMKECGAGTPVYIGCYKDQKNRDLWNKFTQSKNMTKGLCLRTCRNSGFLFAGTQYSSQCFCGNSYGRYGKLLKPKCNTTCSGNEDQRCGGVWKNLVYATTAYRGCYKDEAKRDLPYHIMSTSSMTTGLCQALCGNAGYMYAGLQFANQCFCGNSYGAYGVLNNTECSTPCSGDKNEKCGGTWRNSIYATPPKQKPLGGVNIGCYKDGVQRDLSGSFSSSPSMSNGMCISSCRRSGFDFAGVQYGSQCFCGNSYGVYGRLNKTDCNTPCAGNKLQKCGGTWKNYIYGTSDYVGCFKDETTKDLSGKHFSHKSMTVQICKTYCAYAGYKYAGLQYSDQCMCGNSYGRYGAANNCECSAPCQGNKNETCGGTMRNSIYQLSY